VDVTAMEQIETAVGKNDNLPVCFLGGDKHLEFVEAFNFVRHIPWVT
jgi:hypothetical protein